MTTTNIKNEQPWVEKYRPASLDEIVGQNHIIGQLRGFVTDGDMPHLLFSGSAGIGKTTCALALIRDIQGKRMKHNQSYLELNASDARGIDTVRTEIKNFVKTMPPAGLNFKILILDECDSMTSAAQQALRTIMEEYAKVCRFILICNYPHKIIAPIQSRTSFIQFNAVSDDDIRGRLQYIALNENVMVDFEALNSIIYVSNGDLRRAINTLQSCSSINDEVTSDAILAVSGHLNSDEIRNIISDAIEKGFSTAYRSVNNLLNQRGLSGKNLIQQMTKEVLNLKYDDHDIYFQIFKILGETERNLSMGATESIQLAAMVVKLSNLKPL